jgi:hypothetical protein
MHHKRFITSKLDIDMKKFNLDEALNGAPVVSECGYLVKIAGYNPDANTYDQLAGWMNGMVYRWSKDGEYSHNDPFRLFMAPTERKEWIVVYTNTKGHRLSSIEFSYSMALHVKAKAIENGFTSVSIHEIDIIE